MTNSIVPKQSPNCTPASIELLKNVPTANRFLTIFNPSTQVCYTANHDKVYDASTPPLGLVRQTYGAKTAEAWVAIQLTDLSEFAGCKGKIEPAQAEQMARMIQQNYGHLTIAQLMLFFQKFKRCAYGKFYGAVDPMVIMGALADFSDEVGDELQRRRRAAAKAEAAEHERRCQLDKEPYRRRIPGAFTDKAVIAWPVYCILHLGERSDDEVAHLVAEIRQGRKTSPTLPQVIRWTPEEIRRFVAPAS